MPKISVIVPVYKAEKYLNRCIDSILAQTFTDWELLLIDDGSPDRSGEICDEYASKDNRIRVFHKENGGVSSARQAGLDMASGEYIIHADPDDWAEPKMLEDLYNKAIETNADMVYCDFYQDYKNGRSIYIDQHMEEHISAQSMTIGLLEGNIHGACWNKLIRRELITTTKVKFPDNVCVWEDLWFNLLILRCNPTIAYVSHAYYHYDLVINKNSLVHNSIDKKSIDSHIKFCDYFSTEFKGDKEMQNGLYFRMAQTKEWMFNSLICSPQEIASIFSEINARYIDENHILSGKNIHKFMLSILLLGHPSVAILCNTILIKVKKIIHACLQIHINSKEC